MGWRILQVNSSIFFQFWAIFDQKIIHLKKKMKFYEHNFKDGTTHTLNLVQFFYVIFEKFLAPREKLFMAFCTKKSTEKWQLVSRTCFQVNIHSFLKVLFFEARKLTNNLHDFWICLQRLGWNFKPKL